MAAFDWWYLTWLIAASPALLPSIRCFHPHTCICFISIFFFSPPFLTAAAPKGLTNYHVWNPVTALKTSFFFFFSRQWGRSLPGKSAKLSCLGNTKLYNKTLTSTCWLSLGSKRGSKGLDGHFRSLLRFRNRFCRGLYWSQTMYSVICSCVWERGWFMPLFRC